MLADTSKSRFAKVTPIGSECMEWTEGFWKDAVDKCNNVTVPHLQNMFEAEDISHVLENFRICANPEDHRPYDGTVFGDGDFYKWMESATYAAKATNNEKLFEKLEEYVQLIAKVQLPDGYISTKQIIDERNGTGGRMKDINEFEVYNMGHLFTSACVYYRITGKDSFLNVAKKAAKWLKNMYLEAKEKDEVQTAVCPSHYMGLIEMYRTTGDKEFLELARLAVELRDSVKNGLDDNQDRLPLKSHKKIVGHAVRSTYLYAGVADLYAEEGDKEYFDMLQKVWRNMVDKKLYITGGIGAIYNGASPYGYFFAHDLIHQAFGYEYQLPNVTAYNETCASLGLVFWAYRMFLIEPKAEYMDVLERAMLNVNLAAISINGESFFYENVLRRTKKLDYRLIWRLRRAKYILSYCCPPNLARTIAESSEYAYTTSNDTLYFGLYGASKSHVKLNNCEFDLAQETKYPYDGKIVLKATNVSGDNKAKFAIRIPAWVSRGYISAEGKRTELSKKHSGTYITIDISDLSSSEIIIDFDMSVRLTTAHPLVEECVNQVAVERGPLVYCIETPDVDVETLDSLLISPDTEFTATEYKIKDRVVTALECNLLCKKSSPTNSLYETLEFNGFDKVKARFIPYFAWDNRGEEDDGTYDVYSIENKLDTPDDMEYDEMRIWLPIAYVNDTQ